MSGPSPNSATVTDCNTDELRAFAVLVSAVYQTHYGDRAQPYHLMSVNHKAQHLEEGGGVFWWTRSCDVGQGGRRVRGQGHRPELGGGTARGAPEGQEAPQTCLVPLRRWGRPRPARQRPDICRPDQGPGPHGRGRDGLPLAGEEVPGAPRGGDGGADPVGQPRRGGVPGGLV